MDWTARVRSQVEARSFCFLHSVQTGSEAHSASYPVDTEGSFPGVKRPGREADHSPPSSADVKNGGALHSPIRLLDIVLNKLCTETTLPLYINSLILMSDVTCPKKCMARRRWHASGLVWSYGHKRGFTYRQMLYLLTCILQADTVHILPKRYESSEDERRSEVSITFRLAEFVELHNMLSCGEFGYKLCDIYRYIPSVAIFNYYCNRPNYQQSTFPSSQKPTHPNYSKAVKCVEQSAQQYTYIRS
jgi:hypothetical protein